MLTHWSPNSFCRKSFVTALVVAVLLPGSSHLQAQSDQSPGSGSDAPAPQQPITNRARQTTQNPGNGSNSDSRPSEVSTSRDPSSKGGHPADTKPGTNPHASNMGPAIAGASVGAGLIVASLIDKYNRSPGKLGHDGPQVPKSFRMSDFVIKGLVYPNWPIVLDFMLDSPGAAQIEITTTDNRHHLVRRIPNTPNRRAYAIFRLPADFGKGLQTAVFHVYSIPAAGGPAQVPSLRTYGLGAGERAVGSVAIDQLTFQPATIHPMANEVANYGFHAHSAFDGVRAEFILTTLFNGHVLVQKEEEDRLSAIPEGERARGIWKARGNPGEHLLQIRAWRGLENGGDWVVAWSPDIVDVVK